MKENIRIISIGDHVPVGEFTEIESVFEKVVNFVWGNKVISIGTTELYPGPYHIIVDGIRPGEVEKFEVRRVKGEEVDPPAPLIKGGYYIDGESQNEILPKEDSRNRVLLYDNSKIGILLHTDSRNGVLLYEESKNGVLLNGDSRNGVLLYAEKVYHSALDITHFDNTMLLSNLEYIKSELIERAKEESLAFLLEERIKLIRHFVPPSLYPKGRKELPPEGGATLSTSDFALRTSNFARVSSTSDFELRTSNFERVYRLKFIELYEQLQQDPSPENVLAFHGYGYGLTPAGDDFIIGYMLGIRILSMFKKNELSKQLDFLYSDMLRCSSHRLVNTYVQMAYEGSFTKPWKLFIEALLQSDIRQSEPLLDAVLDIGATSGADTLVGKISALNGLPNSDSAE